LTRSDRNSQELNRSRRDELQRWGVSGWGLSKCSSKINDGRWWRGRSSVRGRVKGCFVQNSSEQRRSSALTPWSKIRPPDVKCVRVSVDFSTTGANPAKFLWLPHLTGLASTRGTTLELSHRLIRRAITCGRIAPDGICLQYCLVKCESELP
jgi:hypothetical protein